ncbi:MAG: hypothetical protein PHY59_06375 [Methanobacterium sp.]|nr:hypothetical protein [Methanobacterium sp.]
MKSRFVTCLNCIDGRVQLPVIQWIMENYDVEYVDMITTPGMDGILSDNNSNIDDIQKKIKLSITVHLTSYIFIIGHHKCLANPVTSKIHKEQIIKSVQRIKKLYPTHNRAMD